MIHGILNIYKEKGYTSHDVVAKLRGILRQKKIGHTGTLDPEAEGVLPVCLGNATRVSEFLTDKQKSYRAVLCLGRTTDTQDATGNTLREDAASCTEEEIKDAMASFLGEQEQIPPMYSALKVDGRRLYDLARQGMEVERKPRKVCFYEIRFEGMELPYVTFSVTCSKGTYIRTLCHDLGEKLGCGGCMEALVRTRSGEFALENSHTLQEVQDACREGRLEELLYPTDFVFSGFPKRSVNESGQKLLKNGNPLPAQAVLEADQKPRDGQEYRIYDPDGRFTAVYRWEQKRMWYRPVKMFLPD